MYKGATVSAYELEQLRCIRDVVRLGYVRRVDRDTIRCDAGTIATRARHLHVHCAARGLNPAQDIPMFSDECITLQPVRIGLVPFNAALVGFIEVTHEDDGLKNRLCPPNRFPDVPLDWIRGTLIGMSADYLWSKDPAISEWLERSRLNATRGLRKRMGEPGVQRSSKRYADNVRSALEKLQKFSIRTDA